MRLQELATALGLAFEGDPDLEIQGLAGLRDATPSELSFVTGEQYSKDFEASKGAVFLAPPDFETRGRPCLRATAPYAEFARAVDILYPRERPAPGTHKTAVVAADVVLGLNVSIGAYAVLGSRVRIGDRSCIHPHVTLYPGVRIGVDCEIHSGAQLRDGVTLGDRCVIQNGAVIGAEGFGFVFREDGTRVRVPHRCPVELGNDCEVGANSTIDAAHPGHSRRGHSQVRTRIGDGVKIDNLTHVGHGSSIGPGATLCAQVGLSGSSSVGAGAFLAGQVGVGDNVHIGERTLVGGKTGVTSDVGPDMQVLGYPHMERRLWGRVMVASKRLPELLRRVRELEKKIDTDDED